MKTFFHLKVSWKTQQINLELVVLKITEKTDPFMLQMKTETQKG